MFLSLPALSPEIPVERVFGNVGTIHLQLAQAMSSQRLVLDADLALLKRSEFSADHLRSLVETGWMREAGSLYNYEILSVVATLVIPSSDNNQDELRDEDDNPLCGLLFNAAQPESLFCGESMAYLETLMPGLGRKALMIIESVLSRFCTTFTPRGSLEMATHIYWCGEENEEEAIESYGEEEIGDIPRRAELFAGVPEWAFDNDFKNPCVNLTSERFEQASVDFADTPAARLMESLAELNRLDFDNDLMPTTPEEGECCEPMAVLRWSEDDNCTRVFDDYYNYYQQGEYAEYMGLIAFSCTDKGLSNALIRIRHTGHVLRALDRVLVEIRDWSSKNGQLSNK